MSSKFSGGRHVQPTPKICRKPPTSAPRPAAKQLSAMVSNFRSTFAQYQDDERSILRLVTMTPFAGPGIFRSRTLGPEGELVLIGTIDNAKKQATLTYYWLLPNGITCVGVSEPRQLTELDQLRVDYTPWSFQAPIQPATAELRG